MASNGNVRGPALGFLAGGIVGTVVGILMAPKSGAETRADLDRMLLEHQQIASQCVPQFMGDLRGFGKARPREDHGQDEAHEKGKNDINGDHKN